MIEIVEDKNGSIIIAKTDKNVGFDDMIASLNFLENNKSLPRKLRLIEDARGSVANLSTIEIKTLTKKLESVANNFETIRHAVIHDNPVNTAYAFIIDNRKKANNYFLKTFTSREGALKWVGYDPIS